jgi:hypothetical protein
VTLRRGDRRRDAGPQVGWRLDVPERTGFVHDAGEALERAVAFVAGRQMCLDRQFIPFRQLVGQVVRQANRPLSMSRALDVHVAFSFS